MKLQRVKLRSSSELERLGEEIHRLREPGRHLMLPDDLKVMVCRLHQAGATFAEIRRVTGVQSASIRAWSKKVTLALIPRPFRIVTVQERSVEVNPISTLTFRFASGNVTVDVPLAALSPELMRVLTSC